MGIEPYQVAASLVGVVSQRLVRRNCEYCTVSEEIPDTTSKYIKKITDQKTLKLLTGQGCTICRNTGFFDRVGAFQLFEITEPIRELISQRPSPSHLEKLSREHGLRSLKQETLLLAARGLTSVAEVMNFIEEEEEVELPQIFESVHVEVPIALSQPKTGETNTKRTTAPKQIKSLIRIQKKPINPKSFVKAGAKTTPKKKKNTTK
jgi:Tfp pilus assembly pilus retraction ATPase PilT